MSRRLVIDLELCILAGECVYNHPAVFAWGDGDHPSVVRPEIDGPDSEHAAAQAIAVCPSGAISIVDDDPA